MTQEKTKLLLVTDTYRPKVDGTIKFIEEFTKRAKKEFDLTLIVPKFGQGDKSKDGETILLETSKRIIPLPTYPLIKPSLVNLRKIKKAIKNTNIVFVQGPALASLLSIYYAWKFEKKSVFYIHVLPWELFDKSTQTILGKLLSYFVEKASIFIYNRCTCLFVPYRELQEQLSSLGVNKPMKVAKLGVDINLFVPIKDKQTKKKKMGLDPDKFVIGYVGRVSKEKNIPILKEAFQKLIEIPNKQLLIVGDGSKEQTEELKNIKDIKLTGFVDDVENYMKAMDVFVLPSLTETTSLVTLEAMSCGLPVIVSKIGFMKRYVLKDHNGVFFPKNSSSVLALKILKLAKNEKLRHKLGQNARKTVAYSFSWERSINRIKRLLQNL